MERAVHHTIDVILHQKQRHVMMEKWRESSDRIHLRIWDVALVTDVHEVMMYRMDEHVHHMLSVALMV